MGHMNQIQAEGTGLHVNNVPHYRVALFHMEEFEAAKQALEEGQRLDPSNKQYKPWIRKCQAELDGENGLLMVWVYLGQTYRQDDLLLLFLR